MVKVLRWWGPAALIAGAGVLVLWLIRPSWYICADGIDAEGNPVGGCFDGHTDGPLILFSILLLLELAAVAVLAAALPQERRLGVLGLLLGALAVTVLVGVVVSFSGLWPDAIPNPLPLFDR